MSLIERFGITAGLRFWGKMSRQNDVIMKQRLSLTSFCRKTLCFVPLGVHCARINVSPAVIPEWSKRLTTRRMVAAITGVVVPGNRRYFWRKNCGTYLFIILSEPLPTVKSEEVYKHVALEIWLFMARDGSLTGLWQVIERPLYKWISSSWFIAFWGHQHFPC